MIEEQLENMRQEEGAEFVNYNYKFITHTNTNNKLTSSSLQEIEEFKSESKAASTNSELCGEIEAHSNEVENNNSIDQIESFRNESSPRGKSIEKSDFLISSGAIFRIEKILTRRLTAKRNTLMMKKRNLHIDVILKKLLSRFFKYIHFDLICPCVDRSALKSKNLKLNQKFVTDVSFLTIKNYIFKPLEKVYSEQGHLRSFFQDEELVSILADKRDFIRDLFNRTLDDIYSEYLESDRFQLEFDSFIRKKNNYIYMDKYIKTAHDFLNLF